MDSLRIIPKKNYILLGLILGISFLLLFYFYKWIDVYNESKINKPILDKYMEVINYNELDNYIVENQNGLIYVSKLLDENIREFEKKLKNKLKNREINSKIYYMDITKELDNKNIVKDIKEKYRYNNLNITEVPCLLIIKNGQIDNIYLIKNNNYDIDLFINYINRYIESDKIYRE